jgi:hypothetical protein
MFTGEFRDSTLGPIYDQLAQKSVTVEEFQTLLHDALAAYATTH